MSTIDEIDDKTRTEIEAAVYRQLVEHLRKYPEVQNIDLMNLAYFCRNCLSLRRHDPVGSRQTTDFYRLSVAA